MTISSVRPRWPRRFEEDGERRVDLDLVVTRQESGGAAIKGQATFVVP